MKCTRDGCERNVLAKGLCPSHYYQKRKWEKGINTKRKPCENIGCENISNGFELCCKCKGRILLQENYDPQRLSICKLGKNNPRWNGGVSEYPNHAEFKKKRIIILSAAYYTCEICKENKATQVHHKDRNKANHELSNLIAVCQKCHINIHKEESGRPKVHPLGLVKLSEITGVSIATISRYLRNKNSISRISVKEKLEKII
jgi:hypothetical protein